LDPGLDSVFVENGRIMHYQPDAYSNSNSRSHTDANTDPEPRPGMQRDSDLDRDRDLHWRPAGEPERLHL
jgi:hypothetical protein